MKLRYILIGLSILVILILVIVFLPKLKNNKKIENIKRLRFSYSTGYHMNANVYYELELKDDKYMVIIKPTDISDEEKQEVEITKEKVKEIEDKLNEYKVYKWNGFKKSNKYVLDGDSFSMSIKLEDDTSIDSSGYMEWPNNYSSVRNYLDSVLGSLYTKEKE